MSIDSAIQASRVIPNDSAPTPGCPAPPPGGTTFTVPEQGIATPVDRIEGLEHLLWIFGHSRWQNRLGVLGNLEAINVGAELFVEGVDPETGQPMPRRRYVVDGLYLTDIDSGGSLVTSGIRATSGKPAVVLQTSVREDGANKQWILDRQTVMAKSRNLIQGDVNDPCKYLLLFVVAQPS